MSAFLAPRIVLFAPVVQENYLLQFIDPFVQLAQFKPSAITAGPAGWACAWHGQAGYGQDGQDKIPCSGAPDTGNAVICYLIF